VRPGFEPERVCDGLAVGFAPETQPDEISCDDWVHRVGEYVEAQRRGDPLDERLLVVDKHTEECTSCAEELDALRGMLDED